MAFRSDYFSAGEFSINFRRRDVNRFLESFLMKLTRVADLIGVKRERRGE